MTPRLAVVIATKNRADALEKYALSGLELSDFRNFVCVVWDASEDTAGRDVCEADRWSFPVYYRKAARTGSAFQRNDAVHYILTKFSDVCWIVFMDDDCRFSSEALRGMVETFQNSGMSPSIVNLQMKPSEAVGAGFRPKKFLRSRLGINRHGATSFLYNYGGEDELPGSDIEWACGGGMAVDVSIFREHGVFFPEAFQRFGGYALGEDFAFSFFVFKKLGRCIVNSLYGHFVHYAAGGSRLNIANMAASKWHNFHLLFDAIYDDVSGPKLWWLKIQFKLFMCAAAIKLLIRARSFDVVSVIKGINAARAALKEFHATQNIKWLMRAPDPRGSEVSA